MGTTIDKLIERAQKKSTNRQQNPTTHQLKKEPVKAAQLPLWPEKDRAAPSTVLRSALFRALKRGQRRNVKRELIASWSGTEVEYTGELLDQSDLDVFLNCLHLSRLTPLGQVVEFTNSSFLKSLGRKCSGGSDIKWLEDSLLRMNACAVGIKTDRFSYEGSLIQDTYRNEETGRQVVVLNEKLSGLFKDGYTRQNWEQRLALPGGLSRWLLGYVVSHHATKKRPHRIAISKLQELCGSETTRLRDFRARLRVVMKQLFASGIVSYWRITNNDCLEFIRGSG